MQYVCNVYIYTYHLYASSPLPRLHPHRRGVVAIDARHQPAVGPHFCGPVVTWLFRWGKMVGKWLSGWWLSHPSEKWWSSSVRIMTFPTDWKVRKISMVPVTTNQWLNGSSMGIARGKPRIINPWSPHGHVLVPLVDWAGCLHEIQTLLDSIRWS